MKPKLALLIIASMLLSLTAQAQFGNISRAIRKKVEQKVEERVTEKVSDVIADSIATAIERGIDGEGGGNKDNSVSGTDRLNAVISDRILSNLNNVTYEQSYSYNSKVSIFIENTDSQNQVSSGYYNTYFDQSTMNYAMEILEDGKPDETGLIVFDKVNSALLILSDKNGEKGGMAIHVPVDSTANNQETEQQTLTDEQLKMLCPYYEATGRTKTILGHKCLEYQYQKQQQTDSIEVKIWVTRDVNYNYSNAYNYMGANILSIYGGGTHYLGTVMEMHMLNESNNERSDMYIREINSKTQKDISLAGYQIIGFGGGAKEGEADK